MPTAQLIEEIVRRVLAESGLASGRISGFPAGKTGSGPKIMVLATREGTDTAALKRVLPEAADLHFLSEAGPVSAEEIGKQGYDRLILPFVSLKTLADLALGRAGGRFGRLVVLLLMAGYKIDAAAFEHDGYRDTAPPALFRLYQEYEKSLAEYGIRRLKAADTSGARFVVHERLVTEQKIADLASRGVTEIQTAPESLITALARDLAREKGIRIIQGAGKKEG